MKNWKTTLGGLLLGLLSIFGSAAQARQAGGPPLTIGNLAPGVGLAILGLLAKDSNSTGGTNPTTPEAVARVNADSNPLVVVGKK